MTQNGGDSEVADIEVERALWRECAAASEALARAFRRAEEVYGGLPIDSRQLVRDQLAGLSRRTGLLILRLGFPGYVTKEGK